MPTFKELLREAQARVREISVEELAARLGEKPGGLTSALRTALIDVREPWEIAIAGLPQALSIPLNELPQRLQELLGYNIHPPFVGYVDGHHPRRVLAE